jgi:hypothetical protein
MNCAVIAKLTYKRHFGMLDEIPAADIPWSEKYDGAVFRGALTGVNRNNRVGTVPKNLADTTTQQTTLCLQVQRCRLVYRYRHSTLVNASLVDVLSEQQHHNLVLPSVLDDGTSLFGQRLSYPELLQYKAIIMLEGNGTSKRKAKTTELRLWASLRCFLSNDASFLLSPSFRTLQMYRQVLSGRSTPTRSCSCRDPLLRRGLWRNGSNRGCTTCLCATTCRTWKIGCDG